MQRLWWFVEVERGNDVEELLFLLSLRHVAQALRVVVLVSLGGLETEVLVDHEVLAHEEDAEAAHEGHEDDERVDVDGDALVVSFCRHQMCFTHASGTG